MRDLFLICCHSSVISVYTFLVGCLNQVAKDHRQARVYPHEILTQSLEDLHHLPSSQQKAWMIMSQREEAYF